MLKMKMIRSILLALTVMAFTACSSGSSNNSTAQDDAINKIVSFAQNGGEAPSVQDYIDAGVSGVTAENLSEINSVVAGLTAEDVDTAGEIQALANQLNVEVTANIPPIAKAGSPETMVKTGDTVKFSSRHSTDPDGEIVKYQWFENGVSIAKVPSVWKVYNVPGTYNIKLVVTDNDGATSSAEYTVTVEASIKTFVNNTPTYLPEASTTTINIDAADATTSITKVTVTIDSTGSSGIGGAEWVGDLIVKLISPNGTEVILSSSNGGSGDYYANTTFDDDAATSITAGASPYTGSFIPEEPLAGFSGENSTGTWVLSIQDTFGYDGSDGTLNSWSITVE